MSNEGVALITGASSGIGAELSRVFGQNGHDLVLTGRSRERLVRTADHIERETGRSAHIVVADLAEEGAIELLLAELAERDLLPKFLVNCAGFGLWGATDRLSPDAQLSMVDVNCRSLAELTIKLLPELLRQKGGILNVSSLGASMPGPGMSVYFASKAFVQIFSESLSEEFRGRGLRVTALSPGPVPTGFQSAAGMITAKSPRLMTHTAEWVAEAGYRGLMRGQRVVVPGYWNMMLAIGGGLVFRRLAGGFVRTFYLGTPKRRARRLGRTEAQIQSPPIKIDPSLPRQ